MKVELLIMEQYPSLDKIIRHSYIYAYDKLDGSNIRAEWTRKTGFTKFGSRRQLIDNTHALLGESIELFIEKYSESLNSIFRKQQFQKTTVFFEYHSPNSFAGFHEPEPHEVTLFDVHVYKQGFIAPQQFNKIFAGVDTAKLLYQGNPTNEFINSVKDGTLVDMTFEGVICKAGYDKRNKLVSYKIKNTAWLDKLKDRCGEDELLFNKLA